MQTLWVPIFCHRPGVDGGGVLLRTPLNIDDELLAEAQRVTGAKEKVVLVPEGLRVLVERESARRLAKLGAVSRN